MCVSVVITIVHLRYIFFLFYQLAIYIISSELHVLPRGSNREREKYMQGIYAFNLQYEEIT